MVGMLFGYTLMYAVLHSLYTQWNVSQSSAAYVVPSAPHSHAEMNLDVPALHDVHQWHDFDESSHFSSLTFTCIYRMLTTLENVENLEISGNLLILENSPKTQGI